MKPNRRFHTVQPGIDTWHTFSAGAHYDPTHLSFGSVIGIDEHRVEPGAGFDWHAHRGVHIVSWVLEGTLRHEGPDGERNVGPGVLLVQSTGDGIRHRETNASDDVDPLHLVQVTILGDAPVAVGLATPPVVVAGVLIDVDGGQPVVSLEPAPTVAVWNASNSAD